MGNRNQNKPIPEGERNHNQFRRPFAPRFLPRERRNNDIQRDRWENEDQRIQPPFQNNNVRDDESYEIDEGELDDLEAEEHNISQFDDDSSSHLLIRSDYQYASEIDHYEGDDYQMSMPEVCQEIPQKSYGLKSGVKHAAQTKKLVKALPLKQNMSANQKQIVNERKDEVVNPEEVNKSVSGFSFEHELNKVKIPMPLT